MGLVDAGGKTKSKVTFVDVDRGIDPRHAEEKRKELERIRRCRTSWGCRQAGLHHRTQAVRRVANVLLKKDMTLKNW